MIHNRTMKEVRRYDIFKLVVLLVLLITLIFMVLRDESAPTTASDGGEPVAEGEAEAGYPAPGEAAPVPGSETAYPAEEAAQPQEPGYPEPGDPEGWIPEEGAAGAAAPQAPGYPGPSENQSASESAGETQPYPAPADNVEPTAEDAPSETGAADLTFDSLQPGDTITAGPVTLAGQGVPGGQVIILAAGETIGQSAVDDSGNWQLDAEFPAGETSIEGQLLDGAGNILATRTIDVVVVAATTPLQPTPQSQNAGDISAQEPVSPTVNLPSHNFYAYDVTLTGSGTPGEKVLILVDNNPETETTVGSDGTWSADLNLAAGAYDIDIAPLDESGSIIEQIPAITLPVLPLPGPRLKLPDNEKPLFDPLLGVFAWRGVANPGTEVVIIANGQTLATAEADQEGQWSVENDLEAGTYEITVAEVDAAGETVNESDPIALQIEQSPPSLDLPLGLTGQTEQGQTQLNLTAGAVTWNGESQPGSDVAIIINKEIDVTVSVDAGGIWTAEGEVSPEAQELQVALLDDNGQIILLSEPIALNVAGSQELLLTPVEIDMENGNATASGTAPPNTSVQLVVNDAVLTTTTSDEQGSFSFDFRLGPGSFEIYAQTVDPQGVVQLSSDIQAIVLQRKPSGT